MSTTSISQPEILRVLDYLRRKAAEAPAPAVPVRFSGDIDDLWQQLQRTERQLDQDRQEAQAILLAVVYDQPCPIATFRRWASRSSFWKWEHEQKLKLERKGRAVCVRPSVFFAFWDALPPLNASAKKK